MSIKKLISVACTYIAIVCSAPASASVIDFEDATGPYINDYNGFSWGGGSGSTSWVLGHEDHDSFSGTGAHSGAYFAWSNGGSDLFLIRENFDLHGFWARGGFSSYTATARGFQNGLEIYSQAFLVTETYQEFIFGFTGIDRLEIVSNANILIDDISVSAVPVPAAVWLFGSGLLGLVGVARRNKS